MANDGANGVNVQEESGTLDSTIADAVQRADAVADRLRIESSAVEDIFDLSGDEPTLVIHPSKLPSGFKAGQREIALLICGARSALGLETGSTNIRTAAKSFDKVDGNLMSNLAAFPEFAIRGKKGSPNRQVRLKGSGWEAVWKLAEGLASDGG